MCKYNDINIYRGTVMKIENGLPKVIDENEQLYFDDIDDIESAELMEEGNIASAMKLAFGVYEFNKIKEAFKEKNGKARISDISDWFMKVAERLGADSKN